MSRGPIDLSTRVRRSDGQVSADLDGEAVLMAAGSGRYFALNATGSRIWALLREPRTVAGICAALEQEFEVDPADCQREVVGHLRELLDRGLVELAPEATDDA